MGKTIEWGFADPMHLFIKYSIFHNFWPKFGPRFWDIFSISGNALMNLLLQHRNILRKSEIRLCWGFADPMHLFIKASIFHYFWPKFRPRFWDIFSISGNALMNHFFSIVFILRKSKKRFFEVMRIRCTFSSNIQFFNFGPKFGPRCWDIFSISGNALIELLLQHRNILQKSEIRLGEVLRMRCTFSSKIQFFIIFGPKLGPRFRDIFSISGNALMNHFFSIVLSCEKAKNGSVRLCGSDAPFHQIFNFS